MSAPTPQNGVPDCCCHSPNRKCLLGHQGKHNHYCAPDDLDPHDSHCPGPACPGRCWDAPTTRTPEESHDE